MRKLLASVGCIFLCYTTNAQNGLNLDISTIKTPSKSAALGIGINYLKQYNNVELQANSSKGFLNFTPEITTQAGTNDAFSQLQLKFSGFYLKGKTITVGGLKTIDSKSTMHIFPISIGAESNADFTFINTLFEVGYIPYYQAKGNNSVSDLAKHTQVGFFIQTGYKCKLDSGMTSTFTGGKKDESAESINSNLFRFKGIFTIDTKNLFTSKNTPGFGVIGKATYWYDFVNKQIYYRIEGKVRLYLSDKQFFDLKYEKGSGAPNFNQGEQFSTGLSMNF